MLSGCAQNHSTWNAANQLSVSPEGQLTIVGSATGHSKHKGIKSPYILTLDDELKILSRKEFSTETTALNPKLLHQSNGTKILSYYRAEAINVQREHSHLLFLDKNSKLTKELKFGQRSRIEQLANTKNNTLLAYNYERSSLKTTIYKITDGVIKDTLTFALSEESNIPIDLLIVDDNNIYISGIAHGFQYNDGHDYKNKAAAEYILKLDNELQEVSRYQPTYDQHSFTKDIMSNNNGIVTTGTQQKGNGGMNVKVESFNAELEKQWSFIHYKALTQYGIKTITHDNKIITLCSTINDKEEKSNVHLLYVSAQGELIKEISIERKESYTPMDFVSQNGFQFILAQKQASRTSDLTSVVLKLDMEGNFIEEKLLD